MRHLTCIGDVRDKALLEEIFANADFYRDLEQRDNLSVDGALLAPSVITAGTHRKSFAGKIVATLFYEASTRTRLSFESAALRLGAGCISTENAGEFSSAIKGETLEDSIRVISNYCDAIVLRHPENGASKRAATVSSVPIINGGDGTSEHPTQAILDLYTIIKEIGVVNGINVTMVGDLKNGRTVHSLARILTLYHDVQMNFVSPPELAMPDSLKEELSGVCFQETEDLDSVLSETEILYVTRLQSERFKSQDDCAKYEGMYRIDSSTLEKLSPSARILHPLPRREEIAKNVDLDPKAAYFRQAKNGLYIRMALLAKYLSNGRE